MLAVARTVSGTGYMLYAKELQGTWRCSGTYCTWLIYDYSVINRKLKQAWTSTYRAQINTVLFKSVAVERTPLCNLAQPSGPSKRFSDVAQFHAGENNPMDTYDKNKPFVLSPLVAFPATRMLSTLAGVLRCAWLIFLKLNFSRYQLKHLFQLLYSRFKLSLLFCWWALIVFVQLRLCPDT